MPFVREKIRADFARENYPLLMLRGGGTGHVVVATDIEDVNAGGIAFYVYLYDPNVPFLINRGTAGGSRTDENKNSDDHKRREQEYGRITIFTDGRWEYPNAKWEPYYFHSRKGSLVVAPYDMIPRKPTFPGSIDAVGTFVFGAAEIAQITDGEGQTLFNPDGTLNSDPATRLLEAAPYAAFNDSSSLADSYILGGRSAYEWIVRETDTNGSGSYSNTAIGKNFSVQIGALPISATTRDRLAVHPAEGSFSFSTTDVSKPLTVTIVAGGASDTSLRTAILQTTSHSNGTDRLSFNASRDELTYYHQGEPASFTVSLGCAGGMVLPTRFSSELLSIDSGETITLCPRQWNALHQASIDMIIRGADGAVRSQSLTSSHQTDLPFSIDRLQVEALDGLEKRLECHTTFSQLNPDSTTVIANARRVAA